MSHLRRFLIVGCNGQFGAIFARKLVEAGMYVDGVDTHPLPAHPTLFGTYSSANIAAPDRSTCELLAKADCVLLCIPENAVLNALPALADSVRPAAVVVDIASVKTRIDQALRRLQPRFGYVSIHPMFGPLSSFESRNMCVITISENEQCSEFISLLERWEARLIMTTAVEHDKSTAYAQSLIHAAILQLVSTLRATEQPLDTVMALATPVQSVILALCARIVCADPQLYWTIQLENPCAAQAREEFLKEWRTFSDAIQTSDYAIFEKQFRDIANYLNPEIESLIEVAKNVIETTKNHRSLNK